MAALGAAEAEALGAAEAAAVADEAMDDAVEEEAEEEATRMCELCNTEQPRSQTTEVTRDHANQVMNGYGCCDTTACKLRALGERGRGGRSGARQQR